MTCDDPAGDTCQAQHASGKSCNLNKGHTGPHQVWNAQGGPNMGFVAAWEGDHSHAPLLSYEETLKASNDAVVPPEEPEDPDLDVDYNEEEHGSKYGSEDFQSPIGHLSDPTIAEAVQHLRDATYTEGHPLYEETVGGGPRSLHPFHDKGDAKGGGAPWEIRQLQSRLGAGKATWIDLYRSMKNAPEHPASVVAKYMVHRYNHRGEYAEGGDKARELDQQFRTLHLAKDRFGHHLSMADVIDLASRNANALEGMLTFRKALHAALQRGLGPKVREINGEPYVALTRGLNSPIMTDEQALRSFGHGHTTDFGSTKFRTWVPLKDVWYSFDLGPTYANGNMGPENEILVSNSGPRYEAQEEDTQPLRYTSSGKEEGEQRASKLPIELYYDDVDDAALARFTKSRLDMYPGLMKQAEAVHAELRRVQDHYRDQAAAIRNQYHLKIQEIRNQDDKDWEDYNAGKITKDEIERRQTNSDDKVNTLYELQSAELYPISEAENKATEPFLAKLEVMEKINITDELNEILEHPALGPITANLLRDYAEESRGGDHNNPGAPTILNDLDSSYGSKLSTPEEVERKIMAGGDDWAVLHPHVNAAMLSRVLPHMGPAVLDRAITSQNANSSHVEQVLSRVENAPPDDMYAPGILSSLATSKLATQEQAHRAVEALKRIAQTVPDTKDPNDFDGRTHREAWWTSRLDRTGEAVPSELADHLVEQYPRLGSRNDVARSVSPELVQRLAAKLSSGKMMDDKDKAATYDTVIQAIRYNPNLTDEVLFGLMDLKKPAHSGDHVLEGMVYRPRGTSKAPSEGLQIGVFGAIAHAAAKGERMYNGSPVTAFNEYVSSIKDQGQAPAPLALQTAWHALYPVLNLQAGPSALKTNAVEQSTRLVRDFVIPALERDPRIPLSALEALWPGNIPFPSYKIVERAGLGNKSIELQGFNPDVMPHAKVALEELAAAIARRREFAKQEKHIILPFPANLAKSDDAYWDAQVAEWLSSKKKSVGFWYGTSMDAIHDIVDRGSLLPQPTKRLLEGKAVYAVRAGSLEFVDALKAWAKNKGEEPAILYFETDLPPETDPAHPKQVYWTEEVPIKNDHVVEDGSILTKALKLDLLVKYQTTFTFPKLGVSDNRRDTQPATTPRQEKIAVHAIAQKAADVATVDSGRKVRAQTVHSEAATVPQHTNGVAVGGVAGVAPISFSFKDAPAGTAAHEDMHKIFNRVAQKYGDKARERLVSHMWASLTPTSRRAMSSWLETGFPQYKGQEGTLQYREEAMAHLLSYLNEPSVRARISKAPPKFLRFFDTSMKRAHRHLQAIAGSVTPDWLASDALPWDRPTAPGTHAYQQAFAKAEGFEGKLKAIGYGSKRIEDWEHAVASMMVGEDVEVAKALAAARFLSGKDPDQEKYVMAMRLLNDPDRAALFAVGLPDNERNLKALLAAKELTEFSKAEDTTILSVEPTGAESKGTAAQIQRGIQYGLIKPLKLKGKHSSGTQVVKDPETDSVWLLKPGSGKLSPGAGIADEKASMSAREAAFWHAAKVMGLDSYIPRTDLLLVNAQEWAAVALVPFNYQTMDKVSRGDSSAPIRILEPYRHKGVLHRWAAMDWILGNVDSHGQNLLTDGQDVQLIDHGSTFAGVHFDPAHDTKSFIPFYLRAWGGPDFAQKSPEERLKVMPGLDREAAVEYSLWLGGIDAKLLATEIARYGIDPKPALDRLKHLQAIPTYHGLLECWAGVDHHEELSKGAMRRLAPNPAYRDEGMAHWLRDYGPRDEAAPMTGDILARGIHRLHAQTKVRRNPVTNEPEFLLYRGMNGDDPGLNGTFRDAVSWSTDPNVAYSFSLGGVDSMSDNAAKSGVLAAWVPQSAIHSIPFMIPGKRLPESPYQKDYQNLDNVPHHVGTEKEVITHPGTFEKEFFHPALTEEVPWEKLNDYKAYLSPIKKSETPSYRLEESGGQLHSVARLGDVEVGRVTGEIGPGKSGTGLAIINSHVRDDSRGNGIGGTLYRKLLAGAKAKGATFYTGHTKTARRVHDSLAREGNVYTWNGDDYKAYLNPTQKSEDLEKGAMRRLAPNKHRKDQGYADWNFRVWQKDADFETRRKIYAMPPAVKARALHRLHGLTQVRQTPDGKREFLLHRVMSPDEFKAGVSGDTFEVTHHPDYNNPSLTSWTPSDEWFTPQDLNGKHVVHAWIPETHIHAFSAMNPSKDPQFAHEKEVIVSPGTFALST